MGSHNKPRQILSIVSTLNWPPRRAVVWIAEYDIRTIFLPKTVAEMLVEFKAAQDMTKEALGAEYTDYNLVVAGPLGMPTEQSTINGALKRLIEKKISPKWSFIASDTPVLHTNSN